jgi:hypothetical protein
MADAGQTKARGQRRTPEKKARVKRFGEVFTPPELVAEMLDKLPAHVWSDPFATWLEPAAGDGAFLVEIHRRLMAGLSPIISNPELRHRHIVQFMLYGIEIQDMHVVTALRRLNADLLKHNILCADALALREEDWPRGSRNRNAIIRECKRMNDESYGSLANEAQIALMDLRASEMSD